MYMTILLFNRISFIKENLTPQPVIHWSVLKCYSILLDNCDSTSFSVSSSSWDSSVVCCWTSKSEVFMAISCEDQIVVQAVENYSEKL